MASTIRIYYWIHHTGISDANTGVQRVVRTLASGLVAHRRVELIPVRWCGTRQAIVRAEAAWVDGLSRYDGPALPLPDEAGEALHMTAADTNRLDGSWLLIPEVTHLPTPPHAPFAPLALALDYARYYRLRSAIVFYDLIPLRVAGYESMVPEHARYAQALFGADLVLPISRTAADDLTAWWCENGYDPDRTPPVRPLLLAAELPGVARVTKKPARRSGALRMVAWGTIFKRKNQLAVMRAINRIRLRRPGLEVQLDLVGAMDPSVAEAVHAEVAACAGRIRLHGTLPDSELCALVQDSDASIFISFFEGFGLPVAESLWLGRPCITSNSGPMAEIAALGGCLTVDPGDDDSIERAIENLATDPELLDRITTEAITRPLVSSTGYAAALLDQMVGLPRVQRISIVEGSRASARHLADAFEQAGTTVRRLHWVPKTQTLLPGFRDSQGNAMRAGMGDLRRGWVVLPLATVSDLAEIMRIEDEARGLGARLAVVVEPGRQADAVLVKALASIDLVLFATIAERDAGLDVALRELNRTNTVRYRYRVACDAAGIAGVLFEERERTIAIALPPALTRVYHWCGTTATQSFNSGVQRSTRLIATAMEAMGIEVVSVKWDPVTGGMVMLDEAEAATLALWSGPKPRPAEPLPEDLSGAWMLVWEIPLPLQPAGSNPARLAKSLGMRVAVLCHDMIPHKMRDFYSPESYAAMSEYWTMFSDADVVLGNSWTTAGELRRYMADTGLPVRAIVACPLAGDLPGVPRVRGAKTHVNVAGEFHLLAVGTWEPRKNYVRLIQAVALARALSPDISIKLTIVGRQAGYTAMENEAQALADQISDVTLLGHVSDGELESLYINCDAAVYASWEEGFGLPVLESLWRGRPCLCHDGSALIEVAQGGGTLAVDMQDVSAIAGGITRLVTDADLYSRICRETVTRSVRSWVECAEDVVMAMRRTQAAPGWPIPAIVTAGARPLLTCAISTYNRANWLVHSLDRLVEATRPWRDSIEVVVCDNTSTDRTPEVVARHLGTPGFTATRNPVNVGMLGNLAMTARASRGEFVWIIGDDDLIIDGTIEKLLTGIERHRDIEIAYMNYSYTRFDAPEEIADTSKVMRDAIPIAYGGANRRVDELREIAGLNENQFTAIYACAFRADHAMRAYQQDTRGVPFSSLATCVPTSVYALTALADRPAWWIGEPALVVNMNVSWLRWVLLWHLERMHDLFDLAERVGIDGTRLDRYRFHHVREAGKWFRMALFGAEDVIRERVSVDRFLERAKHMDVLRSQIPLLYQVYQEAYQEGRLMGDTLAPDALFARHGLLGLASKDELDPRSDVVNAIYRVVLGRDADEDGKQAYVDLLRRGLTPEDIARQLFSSGEFDLIGGVAGLASRLKN